MTSLPEWLKQKRDELADRRSKRQNSTADEHLDKAVSRYLKIGFEDGFYECFAIMSEREKMCVEAFEKINEIHWSETPVVAERVQVNYIAKQTLAKLKET